jgi:hypothetical protein
VQLFAARNQPVALPCCTSVHFQPFSVSHITPSLPTARTYQRKPLFLPRPKCHPHAAVKHCHNVLYGGNINIWHPATPVPLQMVTQTATVHAPKCLKMYRNASKCIAPTNLTATQTEAPCFLSAADNTYTPECGLPRRSRSGGHTPRCQFPTALAVCMQLLCTTCMDHQYAKMRCNSCPHLDQLRQLCTTYGPPVCEDEVQLLPTSRPTAPTVHHVWTTSMRR